MIKKILVFLLVVLVIIQFFRPKRNLSTAPATAHISAVYNTPDEVQQILKPACNDCHSNNTVYPWYANIQPVAWWLNNHIQDGKRHFNLDEFKNYSPRRQYNKMEDVIDEVKEGGMPLNSYTWIHKDAVLSEAQKKTLEDWATGIRQQMEKQYPMDSLLKKKGPGPQGPPPPHD